MEVVAAVSSVAGLISLVVQITSLSSRYVSSMKSSSKTIKGYFNELETLNYVLRRYQELLREPRTAQHASVAVYAEVLDNFREEMERLRSRLQKRSGENAFACSVQRLAWPIIEDKTRQLVETLARYRSSIVAMLGPDHFSLSVRIHDAVEKVQHSIDTMQHQNIVAWLDPMDQNYSQDIARGRHEHNTGDWILGCEPFLEWIQDNTRHFWIKGRPGTGKTILCSTIIDHLQANDTNREATVYFYFDFSDHERQSVQAAIRSLMSQMALKLGISAQQVEMIYRDAGASVGTRLPTMKGLLGALKEIAERFSRVNIVLDGIDESTERLELLEVVARICQEGSRVIHFLITSRPQRSVADALGNENLVAVSLDENSCVQSDIARYVRSFLDRDPRLKRRPAAVKVSIEEALVGKSGGVFRWTECQLDALCHCPTALSIKETLATLPPSLEKTYERLLCGIRPEHQIYVKRALYLLCFSYKPLSQPVFVSEVAEFAVIDPAHGTFDRDQQFYDPEEILEYCSGLIYAVPVSNDVRLAHSSVKEYLLSGPIRRSRAAPFGMTKREAQNSLAMGCLSYLMTFGESKARLADSYKDFPFLSYATHNWHRHIRREENSKSHHLDAMILRFLDSKSNEAFSNWLESFEPDLLLDEAYAPSQGVFSPLYMMAYFKCYEIIPLLVANTGSHHCHGRDCGPAFGIAIRGDIELLEILIHCGCDLQCQLENGESVAAYAARCASSEVLRTLLDAGIETAATRGNPSMLMVAVLYQRREVVDLLLEDGSELFEMDTTFGSVLHAAVSYRLTGRRVVVPDLGIVEALLEWGASPDAHSEKHGSVMHAALASFPSEVPSSQLVEMLRTLLRAGANPSVGGGHFGCALQALMSLRIADNDKQIIFDLLLTAGAQIGFKSGPFGTLLQAAAASNTSRKIAQLILETTEDLNEVTGFFGTALQAASYANNIPVLMLLLDAGADVNTRGGSCSSALTAACHSDRSDDLQLVKALLDHGADVNAPATTRSTYPAGTPLQIAASKGNYDLVRLLLENGAEVNAPGTALGSALHACLLGTRFGVSTTDILAIALLLIASGADINQQSGSYGAPIIVAAASGDPEIVKTLADAGADVNAAADGNSTTALHVAAAYPKSTKALRVLLDTGAVVGPKDVQGRTAIDVACSKGNIAAANALIAAQEAVSASEVGGTTVSLSVLAPMGEEDFRKAMDRWARVDPDHPRPDLYLGPTSSQPTGRGDQAIMMLDLPSSSQYVNN